MGFKLTRIAGIDVHVDWSLSIIFFLIATSLAMGLFPAWHPDWGPGLAWGVALAAAVLFFVSVLLHELSHALVGRRMGVPMHRITLFVFGGMAHMDREPERWRAELWMAAVGPVTSLVIGALCLLAAGLFVDMARLDPADPRAFLEALGPAPTLLLWLGQINVLLAVFNLVPGFPLDGGRVLRAILWGITGNLRRATRWAAGMGQAFAWVLIATGLLMVLGVRVPIFGVGIGGLWLAFIGWFLYSAALMSYRQLLTRESLEGVPVSRLMGTRFEAVAPRISVQELVDAHLLRSGQRAFPVLDGERLAGMACLEDVKRVAPEERAATTVERIMTPRERLHTVAPTDDAYEALSRMGELRVNQLPVVERGRMLGLLRREDVLNWLALRQGGEPAAQPS
ncbi:MAG TPA: site-2 protease family protein [Burkholderiales bacterium]|nr:site-2 protease family protein [Burkholderiales bacterium]